ncbi:hypothetical protein HZR19_00285 [Clostridium botulinum]|nr:hypothetical protein [Clostridium botulinum]MBZ1341624.1 hypothetical protein [Clostridium botulinum]MCW6070889.1 hypothetical protein [Clostridium botulinum]
MLVKNNRSLEYIRTGYTGNYFDKAIKEMNYYRKHVGCSEKNIQNYLRS